MRTIEDFIKFSVDLDYSTFDIFKDQLEIFIKSKIKNQSEKKDYLNKLADISIEQGVYYSSFPGINEEEALENNREAKERGLNKGVDEMIKFSLKLKSFLGSDLNKIIANKKTPQDFNGIANIHPDIYSHIHKFYNDGHYATAVEESYKITREKLVELTGKEKGHEAFKEGNYEILFGKLPIIEAEKNFCEGVKFLHLSIQNFRNEKAHTPAKELDKNRAIHYIYLASLALYLITN